jgi:hypothetical protein
MSFIRRLSLICVIALAACENSVESQLEQQQWEDLGIRDYQFQYLVSCFCGFNGPNPARITVRDGAVTKVEPAGGGAPVPGSLDKWPTIDSLFVVIARANAMNPHVLDVEYDDTYHYPRKIDIDYRELTADDEIRYGVDKFIPLSSSQ